MDRLVFKTKKLDYFFSKLFCSMLEIKYEKICINELINDYNFFYYENEIKENVHLFTYQNKFLVENLLILIGLVPFLKNNSTLEFKINDEMINKVFKIHFRYKSYKNANYIFNKSDFEIIKKKFNDLINYKWEIIPSKKILDIIRYIINNYYDDSCINIFETTLNKNFEYYIKNYKNDFSNETKEKLMSK